MSNLKDLIFNQLALPTKPYKHAGTVEFMAMPVAQWGMQLTSIQSGA
jgi:hypothetical protein